MFRVCSGFVLISITLIGCTTPQYQAARQECYAESLSIFPKIYKSERVQRTRVVTVPVGKYKCTTSGSDTVCTPPTYKSKTNTYWEWVEVDVNETKRTLATYRCTRIKCLSRFKNTDCVPKNHKKFAEVTLAKKVTKEIQGLFKIGKRDGPLTGYYDNGQLFFEGSYKDGIQDGPWTTYHDNGQLRSKGAYKNNLRDGPWVFYNKYGTKRFAPHIWGSYMDGGTGTYKNGVKVKLGLSPKCAIDRCATYSQLLRNR